MWTLYDYCDPGRGPSDPPTNRIAEWTRESLTVVQQAKLKVKLLAIQSERDNEYGSVLPPNGVTGPLGGRYRNLYKVRIQGGPSGANNRVLVCRGPTDRLRELTLLAGGSELNWKLDPAALTLALQRHGQLVADPRRRTPHEWIPPISEEMA
jgi:hypothetical protein